MDVPKLSFDQVREMQRWVDALNRDALAEEGLRRPYTEPTLVRFP